MREDLPGLTCCWKKPGGNWPWFGAAIASILARSEERQEPGRKFQGETKWRRLSEIELDSNLEARKFNSCVAYKAN